jgi:3-phenylpropionate/cinnamic acid dioxygenase small subunit
MSKGSELLHEVEQFLFKEARLADTHAYESWEALWTDDGTYWVPANGEDTDPDKVMSIVYDNRSRIALRVKQLLSGKRYTQEPRSSLARIVGNVEIVAVEADQVRARANSIIFETSQRGDAVWGTRNEYVLRRVSGTLRLAYKKVVLANNERAIPTMSFIV